MALKQLDRNRLDFKWPKKSHLISVKKIPVRPTIQTANCQEEYIRKQNHFCQVLFLLNSRAVCSVAPRVLQIHLPCDNVWFYVYLRLLVVLAELMWPRFKSPPPLPPRPPQQIFLIIIINPLTVMVVGAPQMILQPVFSFFTCSLPPPGTCRSPGLSIPWCCLPTSSFVRLVFFPLSHHNITYGKIRNVYVAEREVSSDCNCVI